MKYVHWWLWWLVGFMICFIIGMALIWTHNLDINTGIVLSYMWGAFSAHMGIHLADSLK